MRIPRYSVRTLMIAVALGAVLTWCGMMGSRSYTYHQWANQYAFQERGWRDTAEGRNETGKSDPRMRAFAAECTEYFAMLTKKYRRATWHPWEPVEPDPYAPGAEEYIRTRPGAPYPP